MASGIRKAFGLWPSYTTELREPGRGSGIGWKFVLAILPDRREGCYVLMRPLQGSEQVGQCRRGFLRLGV